MGRTFQKEEAALAKALIPWDLAHHIGQGTELGETELGEALLLELTLTPPPQPPIL